MDTARYYVAVVVVTFLPPGLLWWFVVHPFVDFWRRVGPRGTLWTMSIGGIVGVAALMSVRQPLVGRDLGTHPAPLLLAATLATVAIWISIARKKHLTIRILAGVPELQEDGRGGSLLDEGIYGVIRHPRYVEVGIGTWAYAAFANHTGAYLVAAATLPLLHLIVLLEERELVSRFGEEYVAYRDRVPRYLPGRRPRG